MIVKSRLYFMVTVLCAVLILAAALAMHTYAEPEFAGGDGTEGDPYLVETAEHLNNVRNYLDSHFKQIAPIDLGVSPWNNGEGWLPIGDLNNQFSGSYDGDGFIIENLMINRPTTGYLGLFGTLYPGATLKNIELVNVNITGKSRVGSLVGSSGGTITNCLAQGTVTNNDWHVGGLVGNSYGIITNSRADVEVNVEVTDDTKIWNTSGGLVGYNTGQIMYSSAKGNVSGYNYVGGLVGIHAGGTISQCYARGDVYAENNEAGGLVGSCGAEVLNSYAAGTVEAGNYYAGGLIGYTEYGIIVNCYAIGEVKAFIPSSGGGLIGVALVNAEVTASYYDTLTSDQNDNDGRGFPRTTSQMQVGYANSIIDEETIYTGWSTEIWEFSPGDKYPTLINNPELEAPSFNPTLVGVHRDNTFYLDADGDLNFDAAIDRYSNFGTPDDIPVIGDWNGDGFDQIGIRRDNTFYLDYSDNMAWEHPGDIFGNFGVATDTVLIGDWNGDGKDQVGVWREGTFFLDYDGNLDFDPSVDKMYNFGASDGTPITGDWNGDGKDQIGVRSGSIFYLDYDGDGAWDAALDRMGSFGLDTDTTLIGDWNGDGKDKIGVHRDNTFYLDYDGDLNFDAAIDKFANFGTPDDIPIIGDWNGDGKDQIGIRRGPTFYLDYNDNMGWEYPGDKFGNFGIETDSILLGSWGLVL